MLGDEDPVKQRLTMWRRVCISWDHTPEGREQASLTPLLGPLVPTLGLPLPPPSHRACVPLHVFNKVPLTETDID